MSDPTALASMRQEHLITLRATIEAVKAEAQADGGTRTIARALDLIELVLRAQEERLKGMDVQIPTKPAGYSDFKPASILT